MKVNKNYVIAVLIAMVCVMAVAYAAFSTSLTINASSTINSTWNVRFDTSATTAYSVVNGIGGTTAPNTTVGASNTDATMSITNTAATLSAKLYQPGDKVIFTLTVRNEGSLKAGLNRSSISGTSCNVSGNTCTTANGHIKFTVGNFSKSTLAAKSGSTVDTATIQVTAEFADVDITSLTSAESASITIPLTAVQVK